MLRPVVCRGSYFANDGPIGGVHQVDGTVRHAHANLVASRAHAKTSDGPPADAPLLVEAGEIVSLQIGVDARRDGDPSLIWRSGDLTAIGPLEGAARYRRAIGSEEAQA